MPNLKFAALYVPEIIGGTPKIWAVPGYGHVPFVPENISFQKIRGQNT